jgi:hypothetical protein
VIHIRSVTGCKSTPALTILTLGITVSFCEIVDVLTDDLGTETGRATDGYSYILQDVETDEELPISFRHQDLVPAEGAQ